MFGILRSIKAVVTAASPANLSNLSLQTAQNLWYDLKHWFQTEGDRRSFFISQSRGIDFSG